jgi:dTDP-4-dehydrorhamnose 3,5-epimerase
VEGNPTTTDGPRKREQSVTPAGERVGELIDGVMIRSAKTHSDERGTVVEIYSPAWGFTEEPLVYVYQITIRPGQIKGWVQHRVNEDRLLFSFGTAKVVLYDDRQDSPTRGMVNELFFDEYNRGLLLIPVGVWHAVKNVGDKDVVAVNCPTTPYDHANPDKWDLPLDTELIPYRF